MPRRQKDRFSVLSRLAGILRESEQKPTPVSVHRLRTTIRRAETALHIELQSKSEGLVKRLKKVRKRAGHVRDIDVQLDILRSLGMKQDRDVIKVRSSLSSKRQKREKKLVRTIRTEFGGDYSQVKELASSRKPSGEKENFDVTRVANRFFEAVNEQELTTANLHMFRIACKHLRYVAELAPESETRDQVISLLKRIQDAIGVWHDYVTLISSVEKVIGSGAGTTLQRKLKVLTHSKFIESLRIIHAVEAEMSLQFKAAAPKKPSNHETAVPSKAALAS